MKKHSYTEITPVAVDPTLDATGIHGLEFMLLGRPAGFEPAASDCEITSPSIAGAPAHATAARRPRPAITRWEPRSSDQAPVDP